GGAFRSVPRRVLHLREVHGLLARDGVRARRGGVAKLAWVGRGRIGLSSLVLQPSRLGSLVTRTLVVVVGVFGVGFLLRACSDGAPDDAPENRALSASPPAHIVPPEVPGEISVRTLLRELVDLAAVSHLPDP